MIYRASGMTGMYTGDCRNMLELADNSIHCVVTSPPYLTQRKYAGEQQLVWADGWKGAFGLEPTIDLYIEHTIEVLREVRRVLRPDGVVFWNLGDSYSHDDKWGGQSGGINETSAAGGYPREKTTLGLKPKDACLIPFRVAIAAQAAGWWVRSVIIWNKSNPMPESVNGWRWEKHRIKVKAQGTGSQKKNLAEQADYGRSRPDNIGGVFQDRAEFIDCPGCRTCSPNDSLVRRKGAWRPTDSHEYILMITKSGTYYCDLEAVREAYTEPANRWGGTKQYENTAKSEEYFNSQHLGSSSTLREGNSIRPDMAGRNLRSVWSFPTRPYTGAHFACVDSETECLTLDGWVRHDELKTGDTILSYDIESHLTKWAECKVVSRYNVVNQMMVGVKHRSLDMLLTPNHRCVVSRRSGVRTIRTADKLSSSDNVLIAAPLSEEASTDGLLNNSWAELIGWYLAEGYQCKGSSNVEIYQNEPKAKRIRYLLTDIQADWNEACYHRLYRGRETSNVCFRINGFIAFRLRELCPEKQFPSGYLQWAKGQRRALINGLIAGDGHDRLDGRRFFCQKNKQRIDAFQALAVTLGYGAVLSPRAGGTAAVYLTNRNTRTIHTSKRSLLFQTSYTGIVWCPNTEYGTFIARRNGKVFITGNTFPEKLPETCIKAATPEHGVCAKCGSPWARVIEKSAGLPASWHNSPMNDGKNKEVHPDVGVTLRREAARTATQYEEGSSANRLALLHQQARENGGEYVNSSKTIGWRPTCKCGTPERVPATVLDPFMGSGTTLSVAQKLGRRSVGYDLAADYAPLADDRVGPPVMELL
jgi:DNA modification methylase